MQVAQHINGSPCARSKQTSAIDSIRFLDLDFLTYMNFKLIKQLSITAIVATVLFAISSCSENRVSVNSNDGGAQADEESAASSVASQTTDTRPDIVVVVADDMRWDITSGQGHPFVRTPNMDNFASEAAMMNNAFVPVALCSPSRASILTGREPHQASAPGIAWRNNSFLQTQRTFAEDLQAAGYLTAYIGKWHLGDGSKPKRGFDHWESFDWLGDMFDPVVHINGQPQQFEGYADDILSARTDKFMQENADSDKPIFLMVGLKAPHLQFEHPVRYDNEYADVDIPRPDSYFEDFSVSGKLQEVKDWLGIENFHCGLKCFNNDWNTYIKKHFRAILGLDDSVGTLRAAIEHRNKTDNTLFIYTSDNGYTLGEHGLTEKHMIYEEPIRVPFLVDFPGSEDRGYRFDGMVSTLDIAPTALDYAQVAIPDYMKGRSLKTLMDMSASEESKKEGWRDELFMYYSEWQVGVRTDRYKYIESLKEEGHNELYDLELDPQELQTVHADPVYADVLAEMQQRLASLMQESQWQERIRTPIRKLLVSSPISIESADEIARATSSGSLPATDTTDANGLTWREVDRGIDRFDIGENVPANSTVLVALPLERTVSWDPHVRIFLGSPYRNAMYVGGEPLWDNYESRPIDYPNPPMVGSNTTMIMRFDGEGSMSVGMGMEAPSGSISLPLESGLTPVLAARTSIPGWLQEFDKDYMCASEL